MTLHFYVHWFWITFILNAGCIDMISTAARPTSVEPSESNISPPIEEKKNQSSSEPFRISPVKLRKTVSKKHDPSSVPIVKPADPTDPPNILPHTPPTNLVSAEQTLNTTQWPGGSTGELPDTTDLNSHKTNQPWDDMEENATDSVLVSANRSLEGDVTDGLSVSPKWAEKENQAPPAELSAAGVAGVTLGCVSIAAVVVAVAYFFYRNRGFNRPRALNDRCSNLDSSGYIDDTSVRDNSEEMYSLDNDSFLNSLEAMTIQNYWTDTVKHTKL